VKSGQRFRHPLVERAFQEGIELIEILLFLELGPNPNLKFISIDGLDEEIVALRFEALGFAFEARQAGDK
jgi:hypothetical protein